jgi:putative membrane protein
MSSPPPLKRVLSRRIKSYSSSKNAEVTLIREQFSWNQKHVTHGGEGVIYLMHSLASGYWLSSLVSPRGRAIPFIPLVIYLCYSAVIIYPLEALTYYSKYESQDTVITGLSQGVAYMSTALFFLLTFRINSAYLRWTRGLELWSLQTAYVLGLSRIVTAKMLESRMLGRRLVRWAIAYLICLKRKLRNEDRIIAELEGILIPHELEELRAESVDDRPQYCLMKITRTWGDGQRGKKPLIEAGSKEIEKIVPYMNEKEHSMVSLVNTPMPYAYVSHLRVMLVIWLGALPFLFCANMGYFAILPCFFIGLMILGMDGMALEIEWPYGRSWNDLPLDNWCEEVVNKMIRHYPLTSSLSNEDGADEGETDELRLNWDKVMEEEDEMLVQEQVRVGSMVGTVMSFFAARPGYPGSAPSYAPPRPLSSNSSFSKPGNNRGSKNLRPNHYTEETKKMERLSEVPQEENEAKDPVTEIVVET